MRRGMEGCGSGSVEGRGKGGEGKGKGGEREGKRKEKGREGKGTAKVITLIYAVSVRFETVLKYRNKPKEVIIFEQNQNCQCFGFFGFEPKKKSVSQDTLNITY
jgi:hypothetical protein